MEHFSIHHPKAEKYFTTVNLWRQSHPPKQTGRKRIALLMGASITPMATLDELQKSRAL